MIHVIQDPAATMELLTQDDWAPYLRRALGGARRSVLISIYMISPHWRGPANTTIDLVAELASTAKRGLSCRLVVDQPNVAFTTRPFNVAAAARLLEAGWKVRVVPDKRTLHEKITLIDRELTIVGSHNISRASATSNYDTSIAIRSAALGERVHRQFWERWRLGRPLKVA